MTTDGATAEDGVARARVARALTEIFTPAFLVVVLLLAVGTVTGPRWVTGLGWGVVAALFTGVIPYGIILLGVRRGSIGDHHVTVREQRLKPLLAGLVSVVAGVALLILLGAPRQVVALVVAMLAGLLVTAVITCWWKISAHAAVAAGMVTILMAVFGPVMAVAWPVVAAVSWSRVVLREHTAAQVLGGIPMGAVVAGGIFLILR